MNKELTCINCPMGCTLQVEIEENEIQSVTGNSCKRGDIYARQEVFHPMRMITSIVPVRNGKIAMVSVKTSEPVEKEKIFDVMKAMKNFSVKAPVEIGQVLIEKVAGTQADIIATKAVSVRAL